MSDDLISRQELIRKIFPYGMPDDGKYSINAKAVMKAIVGIESVEAEPVIYAHWIERAGGTHNVCSNCHAGVPVQVSVEGWLRCCVCGAHINKNPQK